MPAGTTTKRRPAAEKTTGKTRVAAKPAAARPAPTASTVGSMLDDIRARGEKLTSDINALLVRLSYTAGDIH